VIDDDIEKVRELAQYAKLVPAENPEGAPLFHAVKDERLAIAKILLENGAYTVEMDRNGSRFPLEVAYQTGNRDMVRLLLASTACGLVSPLPPWWRSPVPISLCTYASERTTSPSS
jgi:ankyrin repeat protein